MPPFLTSLAVASGPNQVRRTGLRSKAINGTKDFFANVKRACARKPPTKLELEERRRELPRQSSKATVPLDPLACLGARIDTGTKKMNGSKVWFTKGPAQDTFDANILPQLEHLLMNYGLPEGAPLFVRFYMIGPSEVRAQPTVMVCCVDKKLREEARRCVSESGMLKRHGFKLGCSALCLEAKTMPIMCMGGSQPGGENDDNLGNSKSSSILLGSRICFQTHGNGRPREATAGPGVALGRNLYQITVAHAWGAEERPAVYEEEPDLDDFEIESDNEENYLGGEGNRISIGSIFSGESLYETHDEEDEDVCLESPGDKSFLGDRNQPSSHPYPSSETRYFNPSLENPLDKSLDQGQPEAKQAHPCRLIEDSDISSIIRPNRRLDFLLFNIPHKDLPISSVRNMNTVRHNMYTSSNRSGTNRSTLEIRRTAAIVGSERKVILLTAAGAVSGTLQAGATSYRQSGSTTFQKLYIVLIESQVFEGDCGSAVIDASTGDFYGHVILGAPRTPLAYIVPATEVLDDIVAQTGLNASLNMDQFQTMIMMESQELTTETASPTRREQGLFRATWGLLKKFGMESSREKSQRPAEEIEDNPEHGKTQVPLYQPQATSSPLLTSPSPLPPPLPVAMNEPTGSIPHPPPPALYNSQFGAQDVRERMLVLGSPTPYTHSMYNPGPTSGYGYQTRRVGFQAAERSVYSQEENEEENHLCLLNF